MRRLYCRGIRVFSPRMRNGGKRRTVLDRMVCYVLYPEKPFRVHYVFISMFSGFVMYLLILHIYIFHSAVHILILLL